MLLKLFYIIEIIKEKQNKQNVKKAFKYKTFISIFLKFSFKNVLLPNGRSSDRSE